jgi:hypothetical protein
MSKEKSLGITDVKGAREHIADLEVFGDGDTFKLICKASSEAEGWLKSTKAMEIPTVGCVVQVTTQQRNPDGSYVVAEALAFVPGVKILEEAEEGGKVVGRRIRRNATSIHETERKTRRFTTG